MPFSTLPVADSDTNLWVVIDQLDAGWSTRSFPHLLDPRKLFIADNVQFPKDGLVSKRAGNVVYGNGTGLVGTGVRTLSATRFYTGTPISGTLIIQNNGNIYTGVDLTGAFTSRGTGFSTTQPASFAQIFDPDFNGGGANASDALYICDGSRVPQLWNGTTMVAINTGLGFPLNRAGGAAITPKFCYAWENHMVFAGEPTEPGAVYISDAFRPERFTGTNFTDTAGSSYVALFPGDRDGKLGDVTGFASVGPYLIVFFRAGVVSLFNTGAYGGFQYRRNVVSSTVGCTSPFSIVEFDTYVVFFGGDRFYATQGTPGDIVYLPDEVPSLYAQNSKSVRPPEIVNLTTVESVRNDDEYWASYDFDGSGIQKRIAVFNRRVNGGWQYGAPTGGAWSRWPSGMHLGCAVRCGGAGDIKQIYWGAADTDQIAIFDQGVFGDLGNAITVEIRTAQFFLDRPIWPKEVVYLYPLLVFDAGFGTFTSTSAPYVVYDSSQFNATQISVTITPQGSLWGSFNWGSGVWSSSATQTFVFGIPSWNQPGVAAPRGLSFGLGIVESSTNPFNLIGFVAQVKVDEPQVGAL